MAKELRKKRKKGFRECCVPTKITPCIELYIVFHFPIIFIIKLNSAATDQAGLIKCIGSNP